MSLEDANKTINDLELRLTINEAHDPNVEKNHVISQTPPEGTVVNKGDTIAIVISLGPEELTTPNLTGFELKEAKNILKRYGLELGTVSYDYSEVYKDGIVINQSPMSGDNNIEKGDKVNVVVSKGPKQVENPIKDNTEENKKPENSNNNDNNNSSNNNNNNDDTNKDDDVKDEQGDNGEEGEKEEPVNNPNEPSNEEPENEKPVDNPIYEQPQETLSEE